MGVEESKKSLKISYNYELDIETFYYISIFFAHHYYMVKLKKEHADVLADFASKVFEAIETKSASTTM